MEVKPTYNISDNCGVPPWLDPIINLPRIQWLLLGKPTLLFGLAKLEGHAQRDVKLGLAMSIEIPNIYGPTCGKSTVLSHFFPPVVQVKVQVAGLNATVYISGGVDRLPTSFCSQNLDASVNSLCTYAPMKSVVSSNSTSMLRILFAYPDSGESTPLFF